MSSSQQAVARFVVTGRVQGVGFRFFTRRLASGLGLHGTVRNLADGTVEAVAAGSRAALDEFESGLRKGPAGSRVDRVARQAMAIQPAGDGFDIVY